MISINFILLLISLTCIECIGDCRRFRRHSPQHQCVLTPKGSEGPFYVRPSLIRRDIHDYRPGIPLTLYLVVTNAHNCEPLPDLWLSIWMCDALGYYSGYTKWDPTKPSAPDANHFPESDNATFLRGIQQTDQHGSVLFNAVLPGWYYHRTRHIHIKIYSPNNKEEFTAQLYFEEEQNGKIYKVFPYYAQPRLFNWQDYVYPVEKGFMTIIHDMKPVNKNRITDGYVGQMVIGLSVTQNKENENKIN